MKQFVTVARAVRLEIDPITNETYLVFKVTDLAFSKMVKDNWGEDIQVHLINKELKLEK